MEELLKIEEKALYEKLTEFLGKKIQILNIEGWTDREIAQETGVTTPRLSEIKGFEKYRRRINEKILTAFLEKGLITVEEIVGKVKLSEKEEQHVRDFKFMTASVRRKLAKIDGLQGVNVEQELDNLFKRLSKGEKTE